MAASHCRACDKPYADRTGRDPCPRCGEVNPRVRAETSARLKAERSARVKDELAKKGEEARRRSEERVMTGETIHPGEHPPVVIPDPPAPRSLLRWWPVAVVVLLGSCAIGGALVWPLAQEWLAKERERTGRRLIQGDGVVFIFPSTSARYMSAVAEHGAPCVVIETLSGAERRYHVRVRGRVLGDKTGIVLGLHNGGLSAENERRLAEIPVTEVDGWTALVADEVR